MIINVNSYLNEYSERIAAEFIRSKLQIDGSMGDDITLEHSLLTERGIPSICIYKKCQEKQPLIFLIHGRTCDKSFMIPYGIMLAKKGYFIVAIDARLHGEYNKQGEQEQFSEAVVQAPIIDIVQKTSSDIIFLMDYYSDDSRIDTERIGISGFSMGGTITFFTTMSDNRIKVAAPMIDTPDWNKYCDSDAFQDTEGIVSQMIHKYSPINNLDQFLPVALLLQNGDADELVPVSGPRSFCEKMKEQRGKNAERFQYIEYAGVKHEITDGMLQNAVTWFERFL